MRGIFHEGCFTKAEALRAREDEISLDDLRTFFDEVMWVDPNNFRNTNSPFWEKVTKENSLSFLKSLSEEDLFEIFYLEEYALLRIIQDWWKRETVRKRERKAFFLKQSFRRKVEKKEGIFHIRNIEALQSKIFSMNDILGSKSKPSNKISLFFKAGRNVPLILRGTGVFDTEIILSLYQDLYLKGEDFSLFSIYEDAGSKEAYKAEEKDLEILKGKYLTDIFRLEVVRDDGIESFVPDFSMIDLSKTEKK